MTNIKKLKFMGNNTSSTPFPTIDLGVFDATREAIAREADPRVQMATKAKGLVGSVQGSVQSLQDGNKPQQDPHQLDWDQHPITIDPSLLDTKIGEGLPPLISGPTTILGEGRDARLKRVLESDKGKI